MPKSLLMALFLLAAGYAKAQDISTDTIVWTAVRAVNQSDNSAIVYNSSFTSYANQSVDWVQKGVTSHYAVGQVNGNWTTLGQDGLMSYDITGAGGTLTGTITFTRNLGNISIHLKTQVEDSGLDLVFEISAIQAQ